MSSGHRLVTNQTPIRDSARVRQVASIFDVSVTERAARSWRVPGEIDADPWTVGLIVGPSGAGKSTVARALYGDRVRRAFDWDDDAAVVDGFPPGMPVKDVTGWLTAVGFGSPPAWLRPYRALSTGEQFRVDMARALAEADDPCVIDEFTSVVDRQVAQIASHAVQKAARRQQRRFVAVTCHYDVIDWLQPDWMYEPATDTFTRRRLQRHPGIALDICPAKREAWAMFRDHHYLSASLNPTAQCFVAFHGDRPVAFASYLHFPHSTINNLKMAHRLVVLPDYQGLGIGPRLNTWLAEHLRCRGYRYRIRTSHPSLVRSYLADPAWRLVHRGFGGQSTSARAHRNGLAASYTKLSALRVATSFEYVGIA